MEQKDQGDAPDALQQKSSTLVPPADTSRTDEAVHTPSQPQEATASSHCSMPSDTLSAGSGNMEIESSDSKTDGHTKVSTDSAPTPAASSTSSSVASVSGRAPASESISPSLAAASLVAVCSSPQIPFQGTPLASISGAKQSSLTDLKSLPGTSGERQSVTSGAPSVSTKGDVDSKLPDAPEGGSLKDTKKADDVDIKTTALEPTEMTEKGLCSSESSHTTADQSERSCSAEKQPEQMKAELNASKSKEEGKVPVSASQFSRTIEDRSNTSSRLTSPGALKIGAQVSSGDSSQESHLQVTSNASQVISPTALKIIPSATSENTSQVSSESASRGTSSSSKVISPTVLKRGPSASSEDTLQGTSKSIKRDTSNSSLKVVSPTALKIGPSVSSEATLQGTSKGTSQGTSSVSSTFSRVAPSAVSKMAPPALREVSEDTSRSTSKSISQGTSNTSSKDTSPTELKNTPSTSSEGTSQATSKSALHGTSNASSKITSSVAPRATRESSENSPQVTCTLKSALQGASKGAIQEAHKAISQVPHPAAKQTPSGGPSHPPQSTATSSSISQPSKPSTIKAHITSDTPRSTPVKPFQHLPSGMTASSSKQFSAITSVLSKESNKDSKADLSKCQDQSEPTKL